MGKLTTHVLDTMNGCPATGMALRLYRVQQGAAQLLRADRLNADGRCDSALLDAGDFQAGNYRLEFDVAAYFRAHGVALPEPPFLSTVALEFGLADAGQNYHVPLLASPWSYSTYRGS